MASPEWAGAVGSGAGPESANSKTQTDCISAIAREYIAHGFALVPIPKGTKGPRGKGWNQRDKCWATANQAPDKWHANIGLAHAYSGTAALDVDSYTDAVPALAALGVDLDGLLSANDAVQIRSGKPNRAKLLYRLPVGVEPLPSVDRTDAGEGFELRCASRAGLTVQDVLPPSIHPDTGKPYEWLGDYRNLPELPEAVLSAWRALLGPQRSTGPSSAKTTIAEGMDPAALADWLETAREAEADKPQGSTVAEIAAAQRAAKGKGEKLPRFEVVESGDKRHGVYSNGTTRDKDTGDERPAPPVWICSPLYVTAKTRDERGSEWGVLLEWRDPDKRKHSWAMPCEMLACGGDEMRAALLRAGLAITSNPTDRRRLLDYIAWARPSVTARSVSRTGWQGAAFVWPDGTDGDTDAEPIFHQSAHFEGLRLGTAGKLEAWRELVATPCAGNSRLVLALSSAFAGPCIGLAGAEGGGLHFRGESSAGKSTAARVAASTYGPPAFIRSWRTTDNALEGIAAQHSDLLLCLDEIAELPARVAGATAYMLANGSGKSRAARDGSPRAAATWRVLFLSTGEVGMADLIAEAGGRSRAGQEVRVLDIPADAGAGLGMFERLPAGMSGGRFADSLSDAAAANYGHAGRAFVRWLVGNHAEAREALRTIRDALAAAMAPDGSAGQVHRVAQRLALIGAAGELATDAGLTGWTPGEASAAARRCFCDWLAARGTAGASEPAQMLAQVRRFLEAHGEARFAPMDGDAPRTINRAGFRRETPDGDEFLILPEVFRAEVCQGHDPKSVARALSDAGALQMGADGTATRSERLPGIGKARVYRIGAAIWGTGRD